MTSSRDELQVGLISHACIRIVSTHSDVLCDPWLVGTVFNDGWRLDPEPDLGSLDFSSVTHLWISHEHPDHLHLPSLRLIADMVDPARVQVLFQRTNSPKVFEALAAIGYTNARTLDHLVPTRLDDELEVFVYAHRQLDSALGVIVGGENALLDVNDVELNETDCRIIRNRFGSFPVLFNQFSIAGFDGYLDRVRLERQGLAVLQKMADHHRWLGAAVTVPFASFMYFCQPDNEALNEHLNSALDAKEFLESAGLGCTLQAPQAGAVPLARLFDRDADRDADRNAEARRADVPATHGRALEQLTSTELASCQAAFADRTARWRSRTVRPVYRRLGTITAHIADLGVCAVLDFQRCELRRDDGRAPSECDLQVNSQPLYQAFSTPFGIQTLGVSGRYRFTHDVPQWKLVRIISSLANADLYLGPRSALSPTTLRWVWARRRGLLAQIRQQIVRFR